MNKLLLLIAIAFSFTSISALGQTYTLDESSLRDHEKTMVPTTSRYEFIQSHITARNSFRVDKYTGNVYQIVQTKDDKLTWQIIEKLDHPLDKTIEETVNYQMFTSGMAARFTFLLNVNSGATWQLTQDTETDILFWSPIF